MSEECEGDITSRVREIRRQYEGEFDPKEYHATYYHTLDEEVKFFLKCYHDAFNTESLLTGRSPRQRRLLEFGCGPVPVYAAAAAYYTASLTMCEILPKNREELQAWMEGGEEALDWTPFFTYLASLMPPRNGEEVAERLRDVFQLVLPCDLTQREPLSPIRQK
ncbi:Indolethylamine N-methyltransferase-like [Homarus americanus]|uniref:Indolethylamine N-methyltransferase-like n=1 Tax=Homarus americanus TaxID=6706 RepID=A0A8J5MQK9_HOMAM|nr:Indolethylamine N-methyltransferase-like [Homarus americanus]